MKKGLLSGVVSVFLGAALAGCTNFFHDLIPPDGDRITSFTVEGQLGRAIIGDNTVFVELEYGTDPSSLLPAITVSPRATLIPITLEYISAAFPSADLKDLAMGLYTAHDLEAYVEDMIRLHKTDFTVPALTIPMDFTGPVDFFVIAGQGNMRRYTVTMEVESNEAFLTGFAFSKYDNAELINDALGVINEAARTITVEALYPAEMTLSYELIPSFEIRGNRAELDGAEIRSRETVLKFAPILNVPQARTVTVIREGNTKEYSLTVTFREDPDSIRSITDFRFDKANNPGIAATAVASILNSENYGSITVQVFYTGARPAALTPAFISPGTVSVSGVAQNSRVSSHDFSNAMEYRVVSRNNKFVRIYTARVEYIDVSAASPVITSFRFSCGVNHELVQDTAASISDSAGIILITASYGGNFAPSMLVPEFHATGIVTVRGAVQISDFTAQDFTAQVKYTVTDPLNPLLSRDYWVKVSFTRDTSSDAKITVFTFHPDENPALNDELITRIDQNMGTISVYAPVGSGVTAGIMTPRFVAVGHVEVGGDIQTSGVSGRMFDAPVVYTVVSANGANRKDYTVTVSELQSTIFVNHAASGLNDGTTWQNAFISLESACEAAAQFPADVLKEIWIAAGTYVPNDHFEIVSNTCYIGGFAGHEASRSERNVAANAVAISGGANTTSLFSASGELTGELFFEDLILKDHTGYAIYADLDDNAQVTIENCEFSNFTTADNVVRIVGGSAEMSNAAFSACSGSAVVFVDSPGETDIARVTIEDSPAVAFDLKGNGSKELEEVKVSRGKGIEVANFSGNITISDMELRDITGNGIQITDSSGEVIINNLELQDITGTGITLGNVSGVKYFSNVDGRNISGNAMNSTSSGTGAFTLIDSNFNATGSVTISGSTALVTVRDIEMNNTSGSSTLSVTTTSNVTIDTVALDRLGMVISSGGTAQILDSTIKNYSGRGISLSGLGSSEIHGTIIENCVGSSIIFSSQRGMLTVSDLNLQNIPGQGIVKTDGGVNLSHVNITNVNGSDAINLSSGTLASTIDTVTIDGVPNGRGITINSGGATQISTATIRNCNTTGNGGGINFIGSGNKTIIDTTIDETEADDHGGGINVTFSSTHTNTVITNTVVKNTKGGSGGGIYLATSNAVITGTTIENAEASYVGGIYSFGSKLDVSNTTIRNCTAGGGGIAGITLVTPSGNNTISTTIIENCTGYGIDSYGARQNYTLTVNGLELRNHIGLGINIAPDNSVNHYPYDGDVILSNINATNVRGRVLSIISDGLVELTDSEFINCTSSNGALILNAGDFAFIRNCTFTHNSGLVDMGTSTNSSIFGGSGGNFENCTFNNLKGTRTGENYLFSAFSDYPNTSTGTGGTVFNDGGNYTLKNCTFNFNAGSAGLLVLGSGSVASDGDHIDHLLMDGVTINNNGGQTPLIWLTRNNNRPADTFQFKANNVYNGTTLNNAAAITSLVTSGLIRLSPDAQPTLVP